MMKLRSAAILFSVLLVPAIAHSQERPAAVSLPQATQAPVESRFEIVQVSFMKEPLLLKLDKYTGEVFELARNRDYVREKGQTNAWQATRWTSRPAPEEIDTQRPNFQVFGSTYSQDTVFLINVNTGDSWSLYREQAAERDFTWVPVKTQRK